jgi:ParB family chromosome partitioning protein
MEKTVAIEWVRVEGRYRQDLGDVEALAKSIASEGLINAITVTSDGRLVAGERRLAAVRLLGHDFIDARVVDNLNDAASLLRAERDENTERKEMTPEELARLGMALEEIERPKAMERKVASAHAAGRARHGLPPATRSEDRDADVTGETRHVVAGALGVSPSTYARAKAVVEAADDVAAPAEVQEIAKTALAEMNETGNVTAAYEKVRGRRGPLATTPQKPTLTTAQQQRKAIDAAIVKLSGLGHGLKQIEVLHPDITSEEAAQWVGDLSEARLVIERLIKRLRERSSAQA